MSLPIRPPYYCFVPPVWGDMSPSISSRPRENPDDRWGHQQSLGLIYTQKFQKAGMSILGDAKSYYVKNSSVKSVIIYIYMNILKMNFWIFLH